jgi:hypothetical protein
MIAHLQNGRYNDEQILQEETARQMHTLQFTHDERLVGWGLGFSVGKLNGKEIYGHGGDTVYFHSDMVMLPEENVGVYISTNSDRGYLLRSDFIRLFFERYYPVQASNDPQPPADFAARGSQYAGTYFPARMNSSTVEKTQYLVQPVVIQATEEGLLQATGLFGLEPTFWVEVEPWVFSAISENLPADTLLVFAPTEGSADGEIQYAFLGTAAYIKQPWYGSNSLQLGLLGLTLFGFLAAVIAFPIRSLVQRHYRRVAPDTFAPAGRGPRLAAWLVWIFTLLSLVFWIIFFVVMTDLNNVIFGLPPSLDLVLFIPWIMLVLLAGMLVFTFLAWRNKYWTLTGRILYTLLVLLGVAHFWFMNYWSLI